MATSPPTLVSASTIPKPYVHVIYSYRTGVQHRIAVTGLYEIHKSLQHQSLIHMINIRRVWLLLHHCAKGLHLRVYLGTAFLAHGRGMLASTSKGKLQSICRSRFPQMNLVELYQETPQSRGFPFIAFLHNIPDLEWGWD